MRIKTKNRSKTSHLSTEEMENLKSEYYAGENVNGLVKKYNIDISANNLCSAFPFVYSLKKICKYCNSFMYLVPPPKNAQKREEYFCTTCQHTESIFGCECIQCMKLKHELRQQFETTRLLQRKKKKDSTLKIREYPNSPSLDMLSIKEKAYLGALLRAGLDKKYLLIGMDYGIPQELAPTHEYRELIVAELLERKIISSYISSNQISSDLIGKTLYDICISDVNRNKEDLITYLMYPDKISLNEYGNTIILLREVQLNETIEYMKLTLQQFELPMFESERRYELLFMQILNSYSQAQLFNFIYSAIRNQAAYSKTSKQRYIPISNYIYKKISDRYEQARTNNWKITNFRRAWEGKQTELSKLVSNRLLDIGESSFYQVIT